MKIISTGSLANLQRLYENTICDSRSQFAPSAPTLAVSGIGVYFAAPSTVYYNPAVGGSFTVTASSTASASGIIVAPAARGTEQDLTQIAKVRALGPVAFKNRDQGVQWVEGAWCAPGEYVRVPQYGGDRWGVQIPDTDEYVTFVVFDDLDLIGKITCDPLSVVAYI